MGGWRTCAQVAAGLVVLAAAAGAAGQSAVPRFAAGTDLVILSATAVDDRGRPVTDLAAREFRVYEDGRERPVVHFSEGRSNRARLLVLFDASGSMTGVKKSASARMAVTQVLAALGPDDEAALAIFDHRYRPMVAFTRDRGAITRALEDVELFSSTALHDALDRAARDVAAAGEGRRAVLVVTDGVDTASQTAADQVIARSRALDVPIYTVTVTSPLDDPGSKRFVGGDAERRGGEVLRRYAALSGGAAFTVSDMGGLMTASSRIVGELKHQYRLGYDPPPGPSRFRRIEVRSTRKGVVVRTRSGYVPRA
jgi:Ca-activated chloride channel family protein